MERRGRYSSIVSINDLYISFCNYVQIIAKKERKKIKLILNNVAYIHLSCKRFIN